MTTLLHPRLPAAALAVLLLGSATLHAQHTFQPRSGNHLWALDSNWSPGTIPNATDAHIILQGVNPVTSPIGNAGAQITEVIRLGRLDVNLTGGNWGIAATNSQGRLRWSTSGAALPTLNLNYTTGRGSLTIGANMLDDETGPAKALEIYGSGDNGGTIAFTGNNTGFTGGFALRSSVEQNLTFITAEALGANTVTAYTSNQKIRLGSGNGTRTFANDFKMETGVTQLYLQSNATAGGKTILTGEISGAGIVDFRTYNGGNFEINANNTYTGKTVLTGGFEVTFHDVANFGTGDRIEFAMAGTTSTKLIFAEGNTDDLTKKADGSARVVDLRNAIATFNTGTNEVTFANAIVTAFIADPNPYGGIIKDGSGILRLEGDNRYKVITRVDAGTLLINNTAGSGTGSSAVEVGATLGGIGTLRPGAANSILIKTDATLSAGDAASNDGIGMLTLDLSETTGKLTLQNGSRARFDLGAGLSSDLLSLNTTRTGSVEFLGTTYLDLHDVSGGSLSDGDYTLWSASGDAVYHGLQLSGGQITGGLVLGDFIPSYSATLWLENGDVILRMQAEAVPEPGVTALLISLGLGAMLRRRFVVRNR